MHLLNPMRASADGPGLPAAHAPFGPARVARPLGPRVAAALHAQAARAAARHFAFYPRALGVALGTGSCRLASGTRWVADIGTHGRRWWQDLGGSPRTTEPPMLFTDLGLAPADDRHRRAVLETVADVAPAGSLLLMAVNDRTRLQVLREPAALNRLHRRLRLDALRRPLTEAGAAWAAWGLVQELLAGQPALALCEIGIDP